MDRITSQMHEILNINIIQLLNDKEIYTVLDFINTESKVIQKISNLSFKDIQDIRKSFIKQYSPQPRSALEYYQNITTQHAIIQTGIKNLDKLLEGGLFTGNIYEICGLPASGKTYFCLTLLKNVISKLDTVYYIDTKFDFSGLKLKRMLSNVDKTQLIEALNRILVTHVKNRRELLNILHEIKEKLENGLKLKFIILDSLPVLYMQSTDSTENNGFLNHLANLLNYLVNEFHIVVLIINVLMLWNDGDFKNTNVLKERIVCGKYWFNVPHVRIKLEKNEDKICMTLLKTMKIMPTLNSCDTEITKQGLV